MGGSVFVGIRRKDGTEVLMERWTNPLPDLFTNPGFVDDGAVIDEYLSHNATTAYGGVRKSVTYSSYGVILVDFVTNKILSRQGYCSLGEINVYFDGATGEDLLHKDAVQKIQALHKAGRKLTFLREWVTPFAEEQQAHILETCLASKDGRFRSTDPSLADNSGGRPKIDFSVRVDLSPLAVDHKNTEARRCPKDVRAFLSDNGWKARVRGSRKEES